MKLLIVAIFAVAALSAHDVRGDIEMASYWDGMKYVPLQADNGAVEENWVIDWSTVVPRSEIPGFWDGRDFKPDFTDTLSGRIVGGVIVTPHTHPYQAGLFMAFATGTGLCGGSLVSTRTVLTAAHCPEGSTSVQVVLGAHQITTVEPTQTRITVPASGHILHPQYSRQTLHNDIALLILPTAIALNQNIQPTVLPTAHATDLFVGDVATISGNEKKFKVLSSFTKCQILGWGRIADGPGTSPVLRSVSNPIITNAACQSVFGGTIIASTICMATTGGRSACNGKNF